MAQSPAEQGPRDGPPAASTPSAPGPEAPYLPQTVPFGDSPPRGATADRPTQQESGPTPTAQELARLAFGPYQVLGVIRPGGMGVVYKAQHTVLHHVVALKTVRADLPVVTVETIERFRREAQVVAQLRHPHIVPIYEFGEQDGQLFFAMAFAQGGTLADQLDHFGAEPRRCAALIEKVARAVQFAHDRGVLHRDLKPSNILLDEHGEPWVGDFGLAKLDDAGVELTHTGDVLGTPAYMAPEQAAGRTQDVGPATDVWALGVILYQLLAGRRPFAANGRAEVRRQILQDTPPALRSLRPAVSTDLERIVETCLRKEPARRYRGAVDLAQDLARYLRGEKVRAPRHPSWALRSGLMALTLGVIGLAVAMLFAGHRDDPSRVLLGPTGPPLDAHWAVGADAVTDVTSPDQPFGWRSQHMTLLELLPQAPWPRFRLQARVRHEDFIASTDAGLYFGHKRVATAVGDYHAFFPLGSADVGRSRGKAQLRLWLFPDAQPDAVEETGYLALRPFTPSGVRGRDNPFRELTLEVDDDQVRAYWQGDLIGSVSHTKLDDLLRRTFTLHQPAAIGGPLDGGIGLYLDGGAASFQDVIIKPLP